MPRAKRPKVRRLTDEEIDRYFAQAAATIKEVEESLKPCLGIPQSAWGLRIY